MSKFLVLLQLVLISNLLFPSSAFAYVDPGSGSVIVTTVLGFLAAIGYTFRKYFYRLRRLISGDRIEESREGEEHNDDKYRT